MRISAQGTWAMRYGRYGYRLRCVRGSRGDLAAASGPGELFFFDDPAINGTNPDFRDGGGFGATSAITTFSDWIEFGDLNFDGAIDIGDWDTFVAKYGADLAGLSVAESYGMADLASKTVQPRPRFDTCSRIMLASRGRTENGDTDLLPERPEGAVRHCVLGERQ